MKKPEGLFQSEDGIFLYVEGKGIYCIETGHLFETGIILNEEWEELVVNKDNVRFRKNDKYHRENGPAVEYMDGRKYWYLNGEYHREDGPAIEYGDGIKYWFLYDEEYSEEEYWEKVNSK